MNFKIFTLGLFFFITTQINAQSYSGFLADNYNGVHGVLQNPANISDSRLKMDLNLFGISTFFGNNYLGIRLDDAFSNVGSVFDTAEQTPKRDNFLTTNLDILGPSVMLGINKKSAVALFTRGRFFFNVDDIDGTLLGVIGILLAIMAVDAGLLFNKQYSLHLMTLDFERILMTAYGLFIMIYLSLRAKDRLAIFVVVGSFIFMLGGILFLFTVNRYYMVVGSGIEIIIFSLGLAYKVKFEYEENIALQRQVSLKEGSALRAQMNPHFIFNSLNSIQHLILNNNKVSALKYLTQFGKLTRNILESSIETTATLSEEIGLLKSYVELESLRFEDAFTYEIIVGKDLEPDEIEVPLFLIQPYVENAIVHALLPKEKGKKLLTISFERQKNNIICSVEDNGVGRTESQKKKLNPKSKKRSRGMAITEKRLALLTPSENGKSTVDIIDKYDENGNPAGTKVVIQILEALKTRI